MKDLTSSIQELTNIAGKFGLDPFPMRYEICPADIIYTIGSYGMPTRYHHWSFGKAFHKMKLHYDLGMSKIYELVINSDPCYAFLLDSNTLIQNKLIVAHVLAHSDFFKNNAHFKYTNRKMVDSMAANGDRIRRYEQKIGRMKVEAFLDAAMALSEHIDPHQARIKKRRSVLIKKENLCASEMWELDLAVGSEASDLHLNVSRKAKTEQEEVTLGASASVMEHEKDLLLFIMENNPNLEDWQYDILTIAREEMMYFWPQIETKIMNEGWASFWHTRMIRELDLTTNEAVEFAKLNAAVLQPSTTQLNPYYLGLKIFEDIERRYGRDHMFEVREVESDLSFIRNYLTEDIVKETNLFQFSKLGSEFVVNSTDWKTVRNTLIESRINGGNPYITTSQAGENLYLLHHYEGVELEVRYLEKTLPYVYHLWGNTVFLETILEEKRVQFSYNGEKINRKFI